MPTKTHQNDNMAARDADACCIYIWFRFVSLWPINVTIKRSIDVNLHNLDLYNKSVIIIIIIIIIECSYHYSQAIIPWIAYDSKSPKTLISDLSNDIAETRSFHFFFFLSVFSFLLTDAVGEQVEKNIK